MFGTCSEHERSERVQRRFKTRALLPSRVEANSLRLGAELTAQLANETPKWDSKIYSFTSSDGPGHDGGKDEMDRESYVVGILYPTRYVRTNQPV